MQRRWLSFVLVATLGASSLFGYSQAADPAPGQQFVGAWAGTWEGGGTGKFIIKLEAASDSAVQGSVQVGTEGGDYNATFLTLAFSGSKMTGRYAYPLDAQGEIVIDGDFDAAKANGTWKLVQKGGNDALFGGTWTVNKE